MALTMTTKLLLVGSALLASSLSLAIDLSVVSSSVDLDWSSASSPELLQFSKFDPTLGTLKEVRVSWSHTGYAEFGLENTSSGSSPTFTLTQGEFFPVLTEQSGRFVSILGRTSIARKAFFADGPYDGVTDYAGTSGTKLRVDFSGSGSFVNSQLVSNPQFTGAGLLTLSANGGSTQLGVAQPVGGQGTGRGLGWAAMSRITVEYAYEAVPEPITLGALVVSAISLARTRKSRNLSNMS